MHSRFPSSFWFPRFSLRLLGCFWVVLPLTAAGQTAVAVPGEVKPRVEAVSVFKNGLVAVETSFEAEGQSSGAENVYVWTEVPAAVYGTFRVEAPEDVKLTVVSTTRVVTERETAEAPFGRRSLQASLAGKSVRLTLKNPRADGPAVVEGVAFKPPLPILSLSGQAGSDPLRGSMEAAPTSYDSALEFGYLTLDRGTSREMISLGEISRIEAGGPFEPAEREVRKPALEFRLSGLAAGEKRKVRLCYLTRGMAWAPAYRIDLDSGDKLAIRQSGTIRNELFDLTGTELSLISGFPGILFENVEDLTAPGATLAGFFTQLNTRQGQPGGGVMSQTMYVTSNRIASTGPAGFNAPADEQAGAAGAGGVDLHFEPLPNITLRKGESMFREIAAAKDVAYERVVEWKMADLRDEWGRYRGASNSGGELDDDAPWDALRFRNPFSFPMTTGAAAFYQNDRFLGQNQTFWVNPGDSVCARINKALSVSARQFEVEEEEGRESVNVAGRTYQRVPVFSTLEIVNHRSQPVIFVARVEFSGELLEAQEKPGSRLLGGGNWSVNPRRELEWTIQLKPGETRQVTYRYKVLINQ